MTPQARLAAIRERLGKATPGEWVAAGLYPDQSFVAVGPDIVCKCDGHNHRAHTNLIAHAGGTDGDLAWLLGIAEAAADLKYVLADLRALVAGESPQLLDEDSGGDAGLDLRINDALSTYDAALKVKS